MEVVKCPKCKTTMYRYFGNYFCENCTEFLAFGDAIPFSEFKVFEVKMEKPKEDAICPNCGASDWKLSYSTKEKRDYQVCQKCAFHFPADQPPPAPSVKMSTLTADYIGRGLAVLFLLAIGAGLSVIPFEQTARCLIVTIAIVLGIMIGGIVTLPHSKKEQ